MKKELIVRWMDDLIEEWYRMRNLRTLSKDCGNEFISYIGFDSDMKIQVSSADKTRAMGELAAAVGAKVEVSYYDKTSDKYSFWYKGFEFFALCGKETK